MSLLDLFTEFDAALEWPVDDPLLAEPTGDLPPVPVGESSAEPSAPSRVA